VGRKKKLESPVVETTSGEDKLVMFGWCMTGHHKNCIIKFTGHRCSCECHYREAESVKKD
jgi:hypothetical protein